MRTPASAAARAGPPGSTFVVEAQHGCGHARSDPTQASRVGMNRLDRDRQAHLPGGASPTTFNVNEV